MSEWMLKTKQQIETLRLRRRILKDVPTPEIVTVIRSLREKQLRQCRLDQTKAEVSKLKVSLSQSKESLEREQRAYQEREQMLKDQLQIHKAFMKNLAAKYEETKKSYQEVQLTKTLIAAYRRCYLFRLAQVFLNDEARNLFKESVLANGHKTSVNVKMSVASESGNEQLGSTFLSYSMLIVDCISKIFNVTLLNEFVFKGSKSYMVSAQKGETACLYRVVGRNMDLALRLCNTDICQMFDILGIDKKATKTQSFRDQIDLLSQFLIVTDIDEINYKVPQ